VGAGLTAQSTEQHREYMREWRKTHRKSYREWTEEQKASHRASVREWRRKNPDKAHVWRRPPAYYRANRLRREYGLTATDWTRLIREQEGLCPICLTTPKQFVVDHDHQTGRVRGLLCDNCNKAIGFMKDDPVVLSRALAYLSDVGPRLSG
jgi:hypothetical protein